MTVDVRLPRGSYYELEPIDGGWRVKTSSDGRYYIDVLKMLYNWRLVTTPVACPLVITRGWCYYGHGIGHGRERTMSSAFIAAVMAALAWDGSDDSEPAGYNKRVSP